MNTLNKRYDCLIIDCVNLFYRVCNTKDDEIITISQKAFYKKSVCKFIKKVEELKEEFLNPNGKIYLLFDNYFSRADLQTTFMYADRKSLDDSYKKTRKKESKPFYQSLNFIRYYYIINKPFYRTARIDGLEADDLVKPLLGFFCNNKTCLFVTTDLDWARYLSDKIDWVPDFSKDPETRQELGFRLKFPITEDNIILYKSLFGDESDNIPNILPLNEENFNDFKKIIGLSEKPVYLIFNAREDGYQDNKALLAIHNNERQFQINCQLVSTINCSESVLSKNVHIGDSNDLLLKTVREALGLDIVNKKFSFGKVKRSRA